MPTWHEQVLEVFVPASGARHLSQCRIANGRAGKSDTGEWHFSCALELVQQAQHAQRGHCTAERVACTDRDLHRFHD